VRKNWEWLPSLHDPGPPRLWRIGYALVACFAVAVAGLAALWAVTLALLHHPSLPHSRVISLHDTVGVAQLVFASVAGAGALVALIMAYRRQRVAEASSAHDRTRVLNERFTAIASQLGDEQPAVRLAGVHAMAGLADDWMENRQTCVDVLCAYLRLPYEPDPGDDANPAEQAAYRANREVRHTIIRLIREHLRKDATISWQGLNFDFTGVVFDGGNFTGAQFSGGIVRFDGANFASGTVSFEGAEYSEVGQVTFHGAKFSGAKVRFGGGFRGGPVSFSGAIFSGGLVSFRGSVFSCDSYPRGQITFDGGAFSYGEVSFSNAKFIGGEVDFYSNVFHSGRVTFMGAEFSGGEVSFRSTVFTAAKVSFGLATFSGGLVTFDSAKFLGGEVNFTSDFSGGQVSFRRGKFQGSKIDFGGAKFYGSEITFDGAEFSGGEVSFRNAKFIGGQVSFYDAAFSGGKLSFHESSTWAHPPLFGWDETPPGGVTLPPSADTSRPDTTKRS
jgi:uncharacterized protein YjbI with pentapeptide repeats